MYSGYFNPAHPLPLLPISLPFHKSLSHIKSCTLTSDTPRLYDHVLNYPWGPGVYKWYTNDNDRIVLRTNRGQQLIRVRFGPVNW